MEQTKLLAHKLGLLRKKSNSSRPRQRSALTGQEYNYLIVIDFESTCWKDVKNRGQEIIEFPAVLLNTHTGEIESEFHHYVQPQEHPVLSDFCKELTGITQEQVENGIPLRLCLAQFGRWLRKHSEEKGLTFHRPSIDTAKEEALCTFVTWSDWDLAVCLPYECRRKQIRVPGELGTWIDLRITYRKFYGRKPQGLNGALNDLGILFEGREHSGLHDARNTAKLAYRMACDGCVLRLTRALASGSTAPNNRSPLLPVNILNRPASNSPSKTSTSPRAVATPSTASSGNSNSGRFKPGGTGGTGHTLPTGRTFNRPFNQAKIASKDSSSKTNIATNFSDKAVSVGSSSSMSRGDPISPCMSVTVDSVDFPFEAVNSRHRHNSYDCDFSDYLNGDSHSLKNNKFNVFEKSKQKHINKDLGMKNTIIVNNRGVSENSTVLSLRSANVTHIQLGPQRFKLKRTAVSSSIGLTDITNQQKVAKLCKQSPVKLVKRALERVQSAVKGKPTPTILILNSETIVDKENVINNQYCNRDVQNCKANGTHVSNRDTTKQIHLTNEKKCTNTVIPRDCLKNDLGSYSDKQSIITSLSTSNCAKTSVRLRSKASITYPNGKVFLRTKLPSGTQQAHEPHKELQQSSKTKLRSCSNMNTMCPISSDKEINRETLGSATDCNNSPSTCSTNYLLYTEVTAPNTDEFLRTKQLNPLNSPFEVKSNVNDNFASPALAPVKRMKKATPAKRPLKINPPSKQSIKPGHIVSSMDQDVMKGQKGHSAMHYGKASCKQIGSSTSPSVTPSGHGITLTTPDSHSCSGYCLRYDSTVSHQANVLNTKICGETTVIAPNTTHVTKTTTPDCFEAKPVTSAKSVTQFKTPPAPLSAKSASNVISNVTSKVKNASSSSYKTPTTSFIKCGPNTAYRTSRVHGAQISTPFTGLRRTPPLCGCGRRAVRKCVQSPGPNVGRFFYACPNGRSKNTVSLMFDDCGKKPKTGCSFFKWE